MSAFLFILLTLSIFAIPLLPSLREFMRPSAKASLLVPVDHDTDPRRFALNFRQLVLNGAADLLSGGKAATAPATTGTVDGRPAGGQAEHEFRAFDSGAIEFDPSQAESGARPVLVSATPVTIEQRGWCQNDLYCSATVRCRTSSRVRAVYSESVLALAERAVVARWAHARDVYAADMNELYGRITADSVIHIGNRAMFERLHAPSILFGRRHGRADELAAKPKARLVRHLDRLGTVVARQKNLGRVVYHGDVHVPADSYVEGDLVVHGNLRLGPNVRIQGSLKARGSISVSAGCEVSGGVFAGEWVFVGRRSKIGGPLVGERRVVLGSQCQVGSPQRPVTVSSARVDVLNGVLVHGTVWAREFGRAVGISSSRLR